MIFLCNLPYLNLVTCRQLRTWAVRGSIARVKSRGGRGHPCLAPLPSAKTADILSDTHMATCGELYNKCVQAIKLVPYPNLDNALLGSRDSRALCPMLSAGVCIFRKSLLKVSSSGLTRHKAFLVWMDNRYNYFVHPQGQYFCQNFHITLQ